MVFEAWIFGESVVGLEMIVYQNGGFRRRPMNRALQILIFMAVALLIGCRASYEQASLDDLSRVERELSALPEEPPLAEALDADGTLEGYVAVALRQSPELRASFERWRAATERVSQARRLPEPTLSYGYFIQQVETRVGPQRHRVGLSMSFPWPTKLTAGADAASVAARSQQRRFEAKALAIGRRVAETYWQLWRLQQVREVQRDQLEVLRALSEATGARVAVSSANLADLNQVDLSVTRAEDSLASLDQREQALMATLIAELGARGERELPITPTAEPAGGVPAIRRSGLVELAEEHPNVHALELMGESSLAAARRARADRGPSFTVGVDWIETGEAVDPNTPGSGTDPVMVMVGLRLPLWAYAYRGAEAEAEARAEAYRADALAAENRAEAAVVQALAAIRDADRRIGLYRDTLIPQAEAVYISVVGAYQAGRSTIASTLLAQRELLELQYGLIAAQAAHEVAWARLEEVTGQDIEREESR